MSVFEYNSQRNVLIIPEYGRHVQKMIEFAKTIEDKEKRQTTAEAIINLMSQMVPQGKQVEDHKDKLWKHFFRIANYDIDVVPSNDKIPTPPEQPSLESLPYSQSKLEYRHYGKYVMRMIDKASKMEDGEMKEGFILIIAGYMKMAYKNWNRDHAISDENIRSDIKMMSGGKLILPEGAHLDFLGSGKDQSQNISRHHDRKRRGGSKNRNYKRKKRN